jgi:LPS-assembly protein
VVRVTNLNPRQPDGQRPDFPAPVRAGFAVRRRPLPGTSRQRSGRPIGAGLSPAKLLKFSGNVCLFISITLICANHSHLAAQEVTTVAPPPATATDSLPNAPDPNAPQYPDAVPIPQPGSVASIEAVTESTSSAGLSILDGNVVITFRDRVLQADHVEYNADTGDVSLTGHVLITVGQTDERIQASHGTVNIRTMNGRFYDVAGSVGRHQVQADGTPSINHREVYANGNPFLFSGRVVVKTGPREFQVFYGTITSCQLTNPDWMLSGAEFSVEGEKAYARNSVFHLMNVPILWLPYVTHPVDASSRQTGILIPEIGINSAAKGDTIGEQIYWAINRSTDLTVGTIFYSARGWEQTASLRYRGLGQDFAMARYRGLHDRGYTPTGGTYINQSGTDVVLSARHDLIPDDGSTTPAVRARIVADTEYLSSFPYREAFSSNFNQAVSSDVVSTIYATSEWNGMAASLEGDRYQGEKRIATTKPLQAEEQVHIFHAPALEFAAADHRLRSSGFEWNLDSSVAGLKRTQPNFQTNGMVARLDIRPELAYPFGGGGWRVRPSIAGRETFYSHSRLPAVAGLAATETESAAALNRANVSVQFDVRPPILERTFDSGFVRNLLRHDVRHTIVPEVVYRYTHGIDNFNQVLRFDTVDIASDTNELEYGVTQRLFVRRKDTPACRDAASTADATEILGLAGQDADAIENPGQATNHPDTAAQVCGNREWISWHVAQKYFFDPHFGGAVTQNGPRSILQTTLDFSGISFLTGPRDISPIVSRLRLRTSDKTDVEWDFDFDTCSSSVTALTTRTLPCHKKFTANNVYLDVHKGSIFSGISYARLNAPARSYVEGVLSSVADFNQMRILFGFGKPTRQGLSAAANAGIDLDLGTVQYGAIQANYNWNCCGLSVEYRKYELGTARNDNGYKFNFTLANIGSAGNLRHADQVF